MIILQCAIKRLDLFKFFLDNKRRVNESTFIDV